MKVEGYFVQRETEIISSLCEQEDASELSEEDFDRLDEIDTAVHDCICCLAERHVDWNQEVIESVTAAMESALKSHKIKVRHPGRFTEDNRSFY